MERSIVRLAVCSGIRSIVHDAYELVLTREQLSAGCLGAFVRTCARACVRAYARAHVHACIACVMSGDQHFLAVGAFRIGSAHVSLI